MSNSLYLWVNCTHGGEAFFPIFDLTTFQLRNKVKPSAYTQQRGYLSQLPIQPENKTNVQR